MLKENNKEKNNQIIKIEEKNKKLPKGISQGILKNILKNLIVAIFIMAYFITLNILYMNLQENILLGTVKICATALLVAGIIIIEIAYKKDNGTLAITGIEVLILSMHSLFINHVTKVLNYDFRLYLLTSSYVFAIYYVLKAIIVYTKSRRKYLLSLSDVSDIVKKDEPTVKEAKKRNIAEDDNEAEKDIKVKNEEEVKTVKENKSAKKNKTASNKEKETETKQEKNKKKSTSKNTNKITSKNLNKEIEGKKESKTKKSASKKESKENTETIKQDKSKEEEINKANNKEENKVQKPKSKRGRKPKKEVEEND